MAKGKSAISKLPVSGIFGQKVELPMPVIIDVVKSKKEKKELIPVQKTTSKKKFNRKII